MIETGDTPIPVEPKSETKPTQIESDVAQMNSELEQITAEPKFVDSQLATQSTETSQDSFYENISPEHIPELEAIRQDALNSGALKIENGTVEGSNLTEMQWLLVRSKAFKEWFGDWEEDGNNASIVRDDNGEPLVVYHGAKLPGFEVFDVDKVVITQAIGGRYKSIGSFFTTDYNQALNYSRIPPGQEYLYTERAKELIGFVQKPDRVMPVFLNIRNIKNYRDDTPQPLSRPRALTPELRAELKQEGYDGMRLRYDTELVVFDSAQVKSATRNNADFSKTNDSIYK
jgi:hypothetical protein